MGKKKFNPSYASFAIIWRVENGIAKYLVFREKYFHEQGGWQVKFPGGKEKKGDLSSKEATCRRETEEEVGLLLDEDRLELVFEDEFRHFFLIHESSVGGRARAERHEARRSIQDVPEWLSQSELAWIHHTHRAPLRAAARKVDQILSGEDHGPCRLACR